MSAADVPSSGDAPPVNIDLIDTDALVELDDEYVNNEVHHMPCGDFLKGMCDKGSYCKYSHNPKLEHLGVYTFCHKYQYSACSAEICKYVHASPQEEKVFYETGEFTSPELQHLNLTESMKLERGEMILHKASDQFKAMEQARCLSTEVPDYSEFVTKVLDEIKIAVPLTRGNDALLRELQTQAINLIMLIKQASIPAASSKQRHDKGCQTSSP